MRDQRVLPRDDLILDYQVAAWHHPPAAWSERAVQDTSVLDLGQVYDPIRLDLDVLLAEIRHQDLGRLGGEGCNAHALKRC